MFSSYPKNNEEANYYASLSVETYINWMIISTRAQQICRSFVYSTCGTADLRNVSFLWLLVMYHNAGGFHQRLRLFLTNNTKFFISGGFKNFIHQVKDKIIDAGGVIRCSTTVQSIKIDYSKICVSTSSKNYSSRVYFASSEYAKNYPGTADGAIEAGERAACLVLHHARPQALDAAEMAEFL
ncbi:uncharacterized protein [Chelonus insularis]|uniref:uncharacterized protein n=1 Tax=Chelonus insularis TaxID=460826 RepID=UPI00158DF667|nr:uncharacterized protein LOC118070072 [Chelonus insularis]